MSRVRKAKAKFTGLFICQSKDPKVDSGYHPEEERRSHKIGAVISGKSWAEMSGRFMSGKSP